MRFPQIYETLVSLEEAFLWGSSELNASVNWIYFREDLFLV